MSFDLRDCTIDVVRNLCERFHVYASAGRIAAYAFAVYEDNAPVAAYAWQPPPPQAASSTCTEAPQGVLALSRMVAVKRTDRKLKHVSKPLIEQIKRRIDRTRWPVLVTYSDEGAGHNGYVYECSGWEPTSKRRARVFVDSLGRRTSSYSDGASGTRDLTPAGWTTIQRWEHWHVERGRAAEWMAHCGWSRVPTGKAWRSGNPAYAWINATRAANARP